MKSFYKSSLLLVDNAQSVVQASPNSALIAYTPFGYSHMLQPVRSQTAFNGETLESVGHRYPLGLGYRSYSPVLGRFHSPDDWSPFGNGGLNPYCYCQGDPINNRDPSGHAKFSNILNVAAKGTKKLFHKAPGRKGGVISAAVSNARSTASKIKKSQETDSLALLAMMHEHEPGFKKPSYFWY